MSSGPLEQLEQTLERSIENVRQVKPPRLSLTLSDSSCSSDQNSRVGLPAPGPARPHPEAAAGGEGPAGHRQDEAGGRGHPRPHGGLRLYRRWPQPSALHKRLYGKGAF